MTEADLFNLLKKMEIPVAYNKFDINNSIYNGKEVKPPFILYKFETIDSFNADDKTYYYENNYVIDLVTEKKDLELEQKLETILNNNNIAFEKNEDYIETERIFQISYSI